MQISVFWADNDDDSSTWDLDLACGATVRLDFPSWYPSVNVSHGCRHPEGSYFAGLPVACEVLYRRLVRSARDDRARASR